MVKLERHGGSSLFIRPESVLLIHEAGMCGCSTVRLAEAAFVVKGTPDEVHAELFPEAPLGGDALGDVYTLALDVSLTYADRLPPSVVELARQIVAALASNARTSLGREGA